MGACQNKQVNEEKKNDDVQINNGKCYIDECLKKLFAEEIIIQEIRNKIENKNVVNQRDMKEMNNEAMFLAEKQDILRLLDFTPANPSQVKKFDRIFDDIVIDVVTAIKKFHNMDDNLEMKFKENELKFRTDIEDINKIIKDMIEDFQDFNHYKNQLTNASDNNVVFIAIIWRTFFYALESARFDFSQEFIDEKVLNENVKKLQNQENDNKNDDDDDDKDKNDNNDDNDNSNDSNDSVLVANLALLLKSGQRDFVLNELAKIIDPKYFQNQQQQQQQHKHKQQNNDQHQYTTKELLKKYLKKNHGQYQQIKKADPGDNNNKKDGGNSNLAKMNIDNFILPAGLSWDNIRNNLGLKQLDNIYATPISQLISVDPQTYKKYQNKLTSNKIFYTQK